MDTKLIIQERNLIVAESVFGPAPQMDLRSAFPSLRAEARGTNTEGDVLTQTIDGRSLNEIWREFQASLTIFNRQRQAVIDLLTFTVGEPIEDVPVYAGDDFEEASEFGEPKGLRGGDFFSMGYDFKWYDLAIRYTWKFLAESSASQVEALNAQALEADNRLTFKIVMKAIFNNVNRSANIRGQNYNVYPFYNADGTVPPRYKNTTFSGSETHYLVSGAATVDSGDLDQMELKLSAKGYGRQNGSRLLLLVNPAQVATIRTFRVATGSSYDFIPAQGAPPSFLPLNVGLQGAQPAAEFAGLTVAGRYGNWLIIEEDYVPVGYMLGFATGGDQNASNPVGIREHRNQGLRGLRLVKGRDNDYPLIDSFYQHGLGSGVRHRGAGVVMQIKASGSYDIPADYA